MQKILFLCLIGVVILFELQLRHGHGGIVDDAKIKKQIADQKQINSKLMERNSAMKIKIAGLKGSADSLEARSRGELNLIKPGEVLVLLPGSDLNQSSPK